MRPDRATLAAPAPHRTLRHAESRYELRPDRATAARLVAPDKSWLREGIWAVADFVGCSRCPIGFGAGTHQQRRPTATRSGPMSHLRSPSAGFVSRLRCGTVRDLATPNSVWVGCGSVTRTEAANKRSRIVRVEDK